MRWGRKRNNAGRRRGVIPRGVKTGLFQNQKGRCAYCGRAHRIDYLEIDHKHPVSRGGSDDVDNLQLLCTSCNMRKGIQSDEELRRRYKRVLPTDGSIPSPPIPQQVFTRETRCTRAPRAVRAIYHEHFTAARARRASGCGLVPATVVLLFLLLLICVAVIACEDPSSDWRTWDELQVTWELADNHPPYIVAHGDDRGPGGGSISVRCEPTLFLDGLSMELALAWHAPSGSPGTVSVAYAVDGAWRPRRMWDSALVGGLAFAPARQRDDIFASLDAGAQVFEFALRDHSAGGGAVEFSVGVAGYDAAVGPVREAC